MDWECASVLLRPLGTAMGWARAALKCHNTLAWPVIPLSAPLALSCCRCVGVLRFLRQWWWWWCGRIIAWAKGAAYTRAVIGAVGDGNGGYL